VTGADADADAATLSARLGYGDHPELLAGFPFPHELLVEVRLAGEALTLATTLRPTTDTAVPVAFGYHPYLRLPGAPREAWDITLPVRSHADLDERGIPTGQVEDVTVPPGPLGDRVFDDLYPRLDEDPVFALEDAGRRIEVRFEQGYPVAQVYAPKGQEFICFEPMTAPTDALARGGPELPRAAPGTEFEARFSVSVLA
jgi:galactose mutarotase-like enzyme